MTVMTGLGPGRSVHEVTKNTLPPPNVVPEYVRGAHFYVCLWLDYAFKQPVDPRVTEQEINRLAALQNSLSDIPGVPEAWTIEKVIVERRAPGVIAGKAGLSRHKRQWVLEEQDRILEAIHRRGYTIYDRSLHNLMTDGDTVTMIDFYDIYRHGQQTRAWEGEY